MRKLAKMTFSRAQFVKSDNRYESFMCLKSVGDVTERNE